MKILLIEDSEPKRRAIISHLKKRNIAESDILVAKTMTDFAARLGEDIGLFLIDLKLPSVDQTDPAQNGKAILEAIVKAGKADALLLAVSSYPNDFPELRDFFESRGCILADYGNDKGWRSTLDHQLIQLNKKTKLDFLVFCALQEERNPYAVLPGARQVVRSSIDCLDFEFAGKKGTAVLLPRMGLVTASITASLCIERYKPKVVGMSGLCGGFAGRAKLGQLFISALAYEYQSGKWMSDGFKQEPYQAVTDHNTLTKLRALANSDGLLTRLENGFSGTRPDQMLKPEVGVFTSGSAVIADQNLMSQIEQHHRKVNALDMEVYGIQRAAELSPLKPDCICAKVVVDLGDKRKGDGIHPYGSYVSAKFLLLAIEDYFQS